MATIHIKFRGQSDDVDTNDIFPGQDVSLNEMSRNAIIEAVGNHLDISQGELNDYEVEFHSNGNATIHPQAEFGN